MGGSMACCSSTGPHKLFQPPCSSLTWPHSCFLLFRYSSTGPHSRMGHDNAVTHVLLFPFGSRNCRHSRDPSRFFDSWVTQKPRPAAPGVPACTKLPRFPDMLSRIISEKSSYGIQNARIRRFAIAASNPSFRLSLMISKWMPG